MKYFMILLSLLILNACNPLVSKNEESSKIDTEYTPFLKSPESFSFTSSSAKRGEITISWSKSNLAASYVVKYGTTSGVYNVTALCKISPCKIGGLVDGTRYFIIVNAINSSGVKTIANEISIEPPGSDLISFVLDIPFNIGSESDYIISKSSAIELGDGSVRLIASVTEDKAQTEVSDGTISAGTKNGVVFGNLSDNLTMGLKIGNDGLCNGTETNCFDLSPSWTPKYNSIVAYWKLNGVIGDLLNNTAVPAVVGPNGTIVNTNNIGTSIIKGKLKQGINFDGDDSYIDFGGNVENLNMGRSDQTVAFWVKFTTPNSTLISKSSYRHNNARWFIVSGDPQCGPSSGTTGIYMFVQGAGLNYCSPVATGFNDGNWHHVVGVWKRSDSMFLYVDGSLQGSLNISAIDNINLINTDPFYIAQYGNSTGTGPNSLFYGNGAFDEVAIWHSALTKEEIETIYSRQSSKYAGGFTSRVIDGLNTSTNWNQLAWTTTLPFMKGLPDAACPSFQPCIHENNETSDSLTGYPFLVGSGGNIGDNNLMSGIVGLWHLDEASSSTTVIDDSGNYNTGNIFGAELGKAGKIVKAAYFNGTARITASMNNIPQGASPRTIALWVKQSVAGNYAFFAYGDYGQGRLWEMMIFNNSFIMHGYGGGFDTINVANTSVALNQWTHVTASYNGTSVSIYLNGVYKGSTSLNLDTGNAFFNIGGPGYFNSWYGSVDELAIWNRVLDHDEIKQLYQRGASRVQYQVRTCIESSCQCQAIANTGSATDCDGDGILNNLDTDDINLSKWKGPSGTSNTNFSELNNNSAPVNGSGDIKKSAVRLDLSTFSAPVSSNKYFQYRIIFESDDSVFNFGPEVISTNAGPTRYDNSNPTITNLARNDGQYQLLDANGFSEILGNKSCVGAKYSLSGNGVDFYYYNGSMWAISNGDYLQSSSSNDIRNNIASLVPVMGIGRIQVKTFLHSDGITPCEIDKLQISAKKYY